MKSQSLKIVLLLVSLLTISSLTIVAQDQASNAEKLAQSEAKARVQSVTTNKQVKALIASAKTPQDHLNLATYFNQEADRLEADAKGHAELADMYRQNPVRRMEGSRAVRDRFSERRSTATPPQNRYARRPRT